MIPCFSAVALSDDVGFRSELSAQPRGSDDLDGRPVGTELHDEVNGRTDEDRKRVGLSLDLLLRVVERKRADIVGLTVEDLYDDALRGFVGHHAYGVDKQSVDIETGGKFKRILRRGELPDAVEGVGADAPVLSLADEIPPVHALLHGVGHDAERRGDIVGIETGIAHRHDLPCLHSLDSNGEFRTARRRMFRQNPACQRAALADGVDKAESVEKPRLQASVAIVLRDVIDIPPRRVTLQRYTEQLPYPLAVAVKRGARQRRPVVERRILPPPTDFSEGKPPVKARNRIHKPNISLYDG